MEGDTVMKKLGSILRPLAFLVFGIILQHEGYTMADIEAWLMVGCMLLGIVGTCMELGFD
jgi:hypothetical protein